jgi:DNA polymerase III epsilon subunit-like protein
LDEIDLWLHQFDWDNSMVVAHNAMFDMAILNWHFDIRPKAIADTLSMARAINGIEVGNSLKKLAVHYNLGVKGEEVLQAGTAAGVHQCTIALATVQQWRQRFPAWMDADSFQLTQDDAPAA